MSSSEKDKFSPREIKNIQLLLKQYSVIVTEKKGDPYISEEEKRLFSSEEWNLAKKALPSQFSFCFPMVYENYPENFSKGLESSVFLEDSGSCVESLSVFFENKNISHNESATHFLLVEEKILPPYGDYGDEYMWEIDLVSFKRHTGKDNLTIKDLVNELLDMGFTYMPSNKHPSTKECLFDKEIELFLKQPSSKKKAKKNKP